MDLIKSKRVLLIAPFRKIVESRWVTAPLGVHRLASFLNNNRHIAEVFDINIDNDFKDRLTNGNYDIIGFSVLHCTLEHDIKAMHIAKQLSPNSLLVAGGIEATTNYQSILDKSPCNIVILAEGEYSLLQLCNDIPINNISGIIFKNPAIALTNEQYWDISQQIDYQAMRYDDYWRQTRSLYKEPNEIEINTIRLFTSLFCPHDCIFCTVTRFHNIACNKKIKTFFLSAQQMIGLIDNILCVYPQTKTIFFCDDDVCMNKQRIRDFCNLAKKFNNLTYIGLTRVDSVDEELIEQMGSIGWRVLSYGVESLSQYELDAYGKKVDADRVWNIIKWCKKSNILPYFTIMLFSGATRIEDLLKNYRGLTHMMNLGVGLSIEPFVMPLKGSKLVEEMDYDIKTLTFRDNGLAIKRNIAVYPDDKEAREIMNDFTEIYYRERKFREEKIAKHKHKHIQAKVVLDILGEILKEKKFLC